MNKKALMQRARLTQAILIWVGITLSAAMFWPRSAMAQPPDTRPPGLPGYALRVYYIESGLYPFVQVYIRTFDQNQDPLMNLNELNIGVLVKGRPYDPEKKQYFVESIRNRKEAVRTVLVLDCSLTMAGAPFHQAKLAMARFIDSKRPQDQIAILAIRDTDEGYEIVSDFERDPGALGRRLADVPCDGKLTRLYDTIGAALEMCAFASQGWIDPLDAEYVLSNSIVVFSDGKDEGSALSRVELNDRITQLRVPIPIYSLAYSKIDKVHLLNLQALSKNSLGIYFPIGEALEQMQRCVERIQHIIQNDYVVTFRSYVPADGESHKFAIGVEYPTRSGKVRTQRGLEFEAVDLSSVQRVAQELEKMSRRLPPLADADPYLKEKAPDQPIAPPNPDPNPISNPEDPPPKRFDCFGGR